MPPLERRLKAAAFIVLFAAIPLKMVSSRFGLGPLDLVDFRNLWRAAHDVLAGRTLYHPAPDPSRPLTADCLGPGPDCFVYPPLTAVLAVPFTLLPFSAAAVLFYVSDVAALLAALRVAGLRDWRCYGIALACGPALASFESATITPFLDRCLDCRRSVRPVPRNLGADRLRRLRRLSQPVAGLDRALAVARVQPG